VTEGRHRLLVGSANPGKLREYREILSGLDVAIVGPSELDPVPSAPAEDAASFAENATSKARAYALASGLQTVADDSGLEVFALHGAPGVTSVKTRLPRSATRGCSRSSKECRTARRGSCA